MAFVNKLTHLLPFGRCAPAAALNQTFCNVVSVNLLPKRSVFIYGYTGKNKRRQMNRNSDKNINWAKPLLELQEKSKESETATEEPHMLHVVYLIKTTHGRPWWEKDIIKELGLEGYQNQPVILKNIPSINKRLFEVKHLVKILPLKFPHGLPEHESDMEHAIIKSNGEMVVMKRLKEYEPKETEATETDSKNLWTLDMDTVQKELDKKLVDFNVHTEYFKAKYVYKRNQDGKEYRYNFSKDVPKSEW